MISTSYLVCYLASVKQTVPSLFEVCAGWLILFSCFAGSLFQSVEDAKSGLHIKLMQVGYVFKLHSCHFICNYIVEFELWSLVNLVYYTRSWL